MTKISPVLFLLLVQSSAAMAQESAVIRYEYQPQEITNICKEQMKITDERLAKMLQVPEKEKNFSNTIEAFELILADLSENTSPPTFMYSIHQDKDIRSESEKCESDLGQYTVGIFTRRDLYNALVAANKRPSVTKRTLEQNRLAEQVLKDFKKNGLNLPDDKLKQVKELKQKLSTLETQFASNLNENTDFLEFTLEELEGLPEPVLARFKKSGDKYKVTAKSTDYFAIAENAKRSETRRRMQAMYENRAAEKNTKLLQEATVLRAQVAKLLGYKTWADYRTEDRMAKNSKTVEGFLTSLRGKLAQRSQNDLAKLLKFKKEQEPGTKLLNPWDINYYAYQLKKRDYSLDGEEIRQYFPSDYVVERLFEVYSKLLGVKFVEVRNAKVWAPHVKLYEVRNASDNKFIANFFTDFVPREGKYGHAAAFTLRSGRIVDGVYRTPISAIVANFTPPAEGKPSLLDHYSVSNEVETLFHEFGHIMHQTLTKAPYATLSGTSVARDFVEAPSQMLENWVWDPKILKTISGHYKDHSKKLPDRLIKKMIEARGFNKGYFYTRQLLLGLFDYTIHTSNKSVDPTEVYKTLYKQLTTIDPLPETHFPAGFGHMMGGYDVGYYGYLWSEVFAEDMFTKFAQGGLLNSKIGGAYRKNILEKGDVKPADELLVAFLGRKPNNKAFFKRLGIQ